MTEPQLPIEYWDSWLVARNKINNSWTKLLEDVEAFRPSIWENWNWYIWTTDTGIHAEWYTTSFRVDSWYIQYKEENSNVWNNLIAISELKWDTGNWIESVTATKSWKITTVTITFTEDETPYTFQISDGADWQDGRDWTDWQDWQDWQDGADWVGIAGITTDKVWKITTVTVSYTDGSEPDSFEISDWADGQDWQDGTDGTDWQDWNWIDSVTSTKSWKVTTVTMTFTDGSDPFSFTVTDWEDWQGSWDVLWPSASVDGDIVVFDWVSWKLIKDSWKKLSDLVDIANSQTITWAKTFTTEPILPTKSSLPVSPSSTSPATEWQLESVKNAIPSVIDNVTSSSTTSALSANQWAVLKGLIDDLNARGKFLSLWNCATGLPISFPEDTPYTYWTGDYFMVETIDSSNPATNYRPNWSSYSGTASSTVETNEVAVWDFYVYDGSVWLLATNHWKTVSFANLAGNPSDNVALNAELNVKRFALSNYSDTTTWQAIYDYLVTLGKYPIVVYNNESYIFSGYVNSDVVFRKVWLTCSNYSNQAHQISISWFKLNVTSWTVTEIMGYTNSTANPYLATNVDYSSPYTPTYNWSPATKKYVDDNVAYVWSSAPANPTEWRLWYDTTNNVLKAYDGSNWLTVNEFNPSNAGSTDQVLTKTVWWYEWKNPSGSDYSWVTKTISNWEVEIWLRTIVDTPTSNFTLTKPATLKDWEEYVIRIISTTSYTMTLWTWFLNPFNVNLTLSKYATDQFVFLAIWWELELQPLVDTVL